jgi:4-aminobutyrate aminotransferase
MMDDSSATPNVANQGERAASLVRTETLSAASEDLIARDSAAFFHQALSTPVANTIAQVDGAYILDGEGNRTLDLHGNGVHTAGYNNPRVLRAIEAQIASGLTFAPRRFTNEPAVELAEKLIALAPDGLTRVLFCPGGSEAVEMAVMLAKQYTGRWKTLSYFGAFHGAGFQAVSIGADPHFREGLGPTMPGALHLELPSYYRNPWSWTDEEQIDREYLRQIAVQLDQNPEIAAFVSEPVFYESTVPSPAFWLSVRELCDAHGVLLIFDEVYTALGRTGRLFACEHFVTPDILVIGKAFGGGVVPYAGIIGKESLNTLGDRSVGHYTHEKNPLCAAVAGAVLDAVVEDGLVQNAVHLGERLRSGLLSLMDEFPLLGDVRGLGLNLAVDLVKDRVTKERAVEEAHFVMRYCIEHGVSFKLIQGNVLNLKPALVISADEIDMILDTLRGALRNVQSGR